MSCRSAVAEDMAAIVGLTRRQRARMARWAPVYFAPADGADEGHAWYLEWLVGSPEHDTRVVEDDGEVQAFGVVLEHSPGVWLDDWCWADDRSDSGADLARSIITTPVITCVAVADQARRRLVALLGHQLRSTYWSRLLDRSAQPHRVGAPVVIDPSPPPPVHTFGPFDVNTAGALTVAGGGLVVGSPSVSPPIYDPGGPTCVVDRVVGDDRTDLVRRAMAVAAGRGDAQMVVVVDRHDAELAAVLEHLGFEPQVRVMGAGA